MSDPGPPDLTGPAAAATAGATWEPVSGGRHSQVFRASFADGRATLALKRPNPDAESPPGGEAARAEAVELVHREARRLVWVAEHLHGRGLAAPDVVVVPEDDDPDPVLVTTWLEGAVDPRLMRAPEIAVEAFGRSLASLHEASRRIDLEACPFDASLSSLLDAAAARVDAGLVDTAKLDVPYDRHRPEELLDRARQMAAATVDPAPEDHVFLHGDLCVTNIIFDPAFGTAVGAVDWAFAGVGDRTADLAVTARSLARNLSGEVLPDFFDAYGLTEPDLLRIETYALLEELF